MPTDINDPRRYCKSNVAQEQQANIMRNVLGYAIKESLIILYIARVQFNRTIYALSPSYMFRTAQPRSIFRATLSKMALVQCTDVKTDSVSKLNTWSLV